MYGCDGMGTRRAFPAEGMAAAAGAAAAAETAGAAAAAAGPIGADAAAAAPIPGRPVYGGDAAKATNNAKKPFEARLWLRAGVVAVAAAAAAAAAAASVVRPRDFVGGHEGARLPFLFVLKSSRALRLLSTGGTARSVGVSGSPCVVVAAIVAPSGAGAATVPELMKGCGLRRSRSVGCYVGRKLAYVSAKAQEME
jgi:hypothetical protein